MASACSRKTATASCPSAAVNTVKPAFSSTRVATPRIRVGSSTTRIVPVPRQAGGIGAKSAGDTGRFRGGDQCLNAGPASRLRGHQDRPMMTTNDPQHRGKAKPAAGELCRKEGLEHPFLCLFAHAAAGVRHP